MKRGNLNSILVVILVSFVLILTGSLFNMFSLTGEVSGCAKASMNLFECPQGYSVVPNYNKNMCVYKYQCAVINCPEVGVLDCGYNKSPSPIFGWYDGDYCAFDYECIEKPECAFVPRPPWKCSGDNQLNPVFNENGCIISYQCTEASLLPFSE